MNVFTVLPAGGRLQVLFLSLQDSLRTFMYSKLKQNNGYMGYMTDITRKVSVRALGEKRWMTESK